MRCVIKNLFSSAILVTALSFVERLIGFLYRIFLSRSLGAEGIAIYQIALSVIGVIITITTSGIPITVSRLILKERANKNPKAESDIVSSGIITSIAISVPITLLFYFGRPFLSFIFTDERCYDVLVLILPGVTITSVYAVIRGYFWGNRNYLSYSIIELIEEIVMAVVGVILVSKAVSTIDGVNKAGTAVFISYVISFVISTIVFVSGSGKVTNPLPKLKELIVTSSPITLMRTLTALMSSLVAIILPARLVFYGMELDSALASYGEMSAMAMPILFMPSTIIGSIALVLVPEIAENYYRGNLDRLSDNVTKALQVCSLISIAVIPLFISCGRQIGVFLYESETAGFYLAISSIMMLPMSISMITNSLLNSMACEKQTLLSYVISASVMLAIIWLGSKFLGIFSLPVGYMTSYLLLSFFNLRLLGKKLGGRVKYKRLLFFMTVALIPSTVFGILLCGILSKFLAPFFIILICGIATVIFTFLFLLVFGIVKFTKKKPFITI